MTFNRFEWWWLLCDLYFKCVQYVDAHIQHALTHRSRNIENHHVVRIHRRAARLETGGNTLCFLCASLTFHSLTCILTSGEKIPWEDDIATSISSAARAVVHSEPERVECELLHNHQPGMEVLGRQHVQPRIIWCECNATHILERSSYLLVRKKKCCLRVIAHNLLFAGACMKKWFLRVIILTFRFSF